MCTYRNDSQGDHNSDQGDEASLGYKLYAPPLSSEDADIFSQGVHTASPMLCPRSRQKIVPFPLFESASSPEVQRVVLEPFAFVVVFEAIVEM
jgi:hypothetical protein